jgi:hypothetical protein
MTNVEKVRLLINDVGGESGSDYIFEDDDIQAFLDLNNENVRFAAAEALRTIANNEAQVSKVITYLELKTDGAKVAEAMLKAAEAMEEAEREGAEEAEDEGPELAEMDLDWNTRRYMVMRGLGGEL